MQNKGAKKAYGKFLPVPNRVPERASNVVQVRDVVHAEQLLERQRLSLGSESESLIHIVDDSLDVGGAVLRHVLTNRLEVPPLVEEEEGS